MAKAGGRADGKRASARVREALASGGCAGRSSSTTRSRPSWPAARTRSCARSRAISTARSTCAATCSRSTATPTAVEAGGGGRPRARRADRAGPRDRAGDDRGGHARARRARVAGADPRGRRVAPPRDQGRAEDRQPEALRRLDPPEHDHVRDRPGRHRQDVPGRGARGRRTEPARGQPDHPHPPRGRGRRAARVPARRSDGEGRSVSAAAVRRAARHARARARLAASRARRDRGGAAGIHARPDAERQFHHPRRGAEHDARSR